MHGQEFTGNTAEFLIQEENVMQRYWMEIKPVQGNLLAHRQFGITAFNQEDALAILRSRIGVEFDVIQCNEGIDVSTLDKAHVLPNIGNVFPRGIWFPSGY